MRLFLSAMRRNRQTRSIRIGSTRFLRSLRRDSRPPCSYGWFYAGIRRGTNAITLSDYKVSETSHKFLKRLRGPASPLSFD